jgi:flagellar hook-basal body complex protein FliE
MTIDPVSLSGLAPPLAREAGTSAAPGGASFGNLFDNLLTSASQSHDRAEQAVHSLATGETDNLHGVLLEVAQADLSFRLILQIRNRLTDAYQEIMKMSV